MNLQQLATALDEWFSFPARVVSLLQGIREDVGSLRKHAAADGAVRLASITITGKDGTMHGGAIEVPRLGDSVGLGMQLNGDLPAGASFQLSAPAGVLVTEVKVGNVSHSCAPLVHLYPPRRDIGAACSGVTYGRLPEVPLALRLCFTIVRVM